MFFASLERVRQLAVIAIAGAVLAFPAAVQAQEAMVITGQVTDETGVPLLNVNVYIDGTRFATLTAADGQYQLIVPAARVTGAQATLVASLIGFRRAAVSVTLSGGALTEDFMLDLDPLDLEEIVAVGQGLTAERRRLAMNVGSVDEQAILDAQQTNIVNSLAGAIPNVLVQSAGGEPGAGAYINIRGEKSVEGGTQPLIVVDGTPVSNESDQTEGSIWGTVVQNRAADINPDDIASIEVLKGPSASAIYGAAGANGVVLITTKGGVAGQTQIELKTSYSFDDVTNTVGLQTANNRDNSPSGIRSWGNQMACAPNCVLGVDVFEHSKEAFQTGHRWDSNLTVSGGSDRTTYFVSAGYTDHDGPIIGPSGLQTTKMRVKASHQALETLGFTGNIAWAGQQGDLVQQGSNTSGLLLPMFRTPPDFDNLPKLDETGVQRQWFGGFDNPFFVAEDIANTTDVGRVFGNFRIDWNPFTWLTVTDIFGGDYSSDERLSLFPKTNSSLPEGILIRATFTQRNFDNSIFLTGGHTFSDDFAFTLTAGQNYRQERFSRIQTDGFSLIQDAVQLDFAVSKVPDEFRSDVRNSALFVNATFDIANQLFLQGGYRYEGSSTFGSDQNFFGYPSGSVAWDFTQVLGSDALSFGKLRFAYGEAGVAPPVFSNVTGFQKTTIQDGWVNVVGLESFYLGQEGVTSEFSGGNPFIDPERSREFEGGIDLAFLDSRISAGLTYFDQKTTDAILFLPVPESSGFNTQPVNGASWTSKGWEVTLDLIPFQSRNFTWELTTSWARYQTEVTELLGTVQVALGDFVFSSLQPSVVFDQCGGAADEPCPFGALWGGDFARMGRGIMIDYDGDGTLNDIDAEFPGSPAGTLFIGPDGFPLEDTQSRVIGDPNPNWTAAVRSTFRIFENLRISGLLDIRNGGDMWNGTKGALFSYGTHLETLPRHCVNGNDCAPGEGQSVTFVGTGPGVGQTVALNTNTAGPSSDFNSFNGPSGASALISGVDECRIEVGCQFVEDAGFIKLRDVSLTYDFTGRWLNNISMNRISITAVGRNLFTQTDYTGLDPESNLRGQQTGRGMEYFNNPQVRSFILQISFIH